MNVVITIMNNALIVDLCFIDPDKRDDVKRLAALGYKPVEIAISIGLTGNDRGNFVMDASRPGTSVFGLINEGILITRSAPEIKLQEKAEEGDLDAMKELSIVKFRHQYDKMLDDMDEDN